MKVSVPFNSVILAFLNEILFLCLLINLTARGDAVRRPLIIVSFSILIPNALSSFFSFCAHRLFHRGVSLGGIASDLSLDEIRRSACQPAAPQLLLLRHLRRRVGSFAPAGYLAGGDSPGGIAPDL